jgi:serine-type D-Ala-D-Ala carboxypeptidase/endopeptidase
MLRARGAGPLGLPLNRLCQWVGRRLWVVAPALVACSASPPAPPAHAPPTSASGTAASVVASDAEIQRILAERVPGEHPGFGIVVGVIEPAGRRFVSRGERTQGDATPLDADTLFEIGSITKVFTSLLLADAVQRQEVALADPVAKYLPVGVKLPERAGQGITLVDLATHTSGLPRMPDNLTPKDPSNPYADYSLTQLYQFLGKVELTRDIGTQVEYSNLGAALLGQALTHRAGLEYEALVRQRITDPLGMPSTRVSLPSDLKARLTPGHDQNLQPATNWDLPAFAGAGALRSSAKDLLTLLAAAMHAQETPLSEALALMTSVRRPTNDESSSVTLGWQVKTAHGKEIFWHNGGTGGYRTFIGYDPKAQTGVAVLSNLGTPAGPDDIGMHLLDPEAPLLPAGSPGTTPPRTRVEVKVDPKVFDGYVGRYQLAPAAVFTVTREGDRLYAQLTGQPTFQVFPESATEYFYKVVDAQLSFETDAQNRATALVLHQGGRDLRASRIEGEVVMPKIVPIASKVFDRYVGRYQLAPQVVLSITRQGERYFTQLTGQPVLEIFHSGERTFFLKVVDAQLTFVVEGAGPASAVVLHQNGRDQRAARIE